MNKPLQPPPTADDEVGPLDADGRQIWSPAEEAAVLRLRADQDYVRSVREALAEADAGHVVSHEDHLASMVVIKRRWLADRAS